MSSIRDKQNPSGADIEVYVNERLAKMSQALDQPSSFKAQDYDLKCNKLNEYPGPGWEFVSTILLAPALVGVVWRISRVVQTNMGHEPVMKLTTAAKPA